MKKIYLTLALAAGLFASCDPIIEHEGKEAANMTVAELQKTVTLTQVVPNQNKFTYTTNPTLTVQVLDQDYNIISYGTSGDFISTPPLTSLIVRMMNQDGTIVEFTENVTITDYVDVPQIYSDLFGSDYTSKTWTWDTEASNGVFGNGGYLGNDGPAWWVVQASDIDEECNKAGLPKDGLDGWMKFTIAGRKTEMSRGTTGTIDWDLSASVKEGWSEGELSFNGSIPLLGVQLNGNYAYQYNYQILYLDSEKLHLCAPEPGSGEWGTAWFWNFKVK